MLQRERLYIKSGAFESMGRSGVDLLKLYRKRQSGRDHAQAVHHALYAQRPRDGKRRFAALIAHREQQPRQTAYMVSVKVGDEQPVDRLKRKAAFANLYLRAFAAVDEQAAPLA